MSRIGRKPIPVPSGVEIKIEPELISVKGPKGELSERVSRDITVVQEGDELVVTRPTDRGEHRALHGLTRSLVANMVEGVTDGFEKKLEIQGVGYRAAVSGSKLTLALGYSHPVEIEAPDGISFDVPQPTNVTVIGISKQLVGETAAELDAAEAGLREQGAQREFGIAGQQRTRRRQQRRAGLDIGIAGDRFRWNILEYFLTLMLFHAHTPRKSTRATLRQGPYGRRSKKRAIRIEFGGSFRPRQARPPAAPV